MKEEKQQTRQEKHLAKLVRRNGIYFNPAERWLYEKT